MRGLVVIGHTSRAIDLCFRHQLFDKMQEFASDVNMDGQTDPVHPLPLKMHTLYPF